MKQPFKPAWWLNNRHSQTLWPTLCRRDIKNIHLQRERLELPDGDFIDLEWSGNGNGPVVLILPGFEGSINSPYAKGLLLSINQNGWRGVLMNFRGCSGEPNRLSRSYHSGETTDLNTVVNILHQREPNIDLAVIGVSVGGNMLLKWLGETGQKNLITAAVAISVPFELQKTVRRIHQGFSRVYEKHLLRCALKRLSVKFQRIPGPIDVSGLHAIHSMQDFDDKITAPLHGFIDGKDYYLKSSSRQFLSGINVPTLLIQAKDDPFLTIDTLPKKDELPSCVKLEVTEGGGHVGFVTGKFPWQAEYWLEQRIPLFLREYL